MQALCTCCYVHLSGLFLIHMSTLLTSSTWEWMMPISFAIWHAMPPQYTLLLHAIPYTDWYLLIVSLTDKVSILYIQASVAFCWNVCHYGQCYRIGTAKVQRFIGKGISQIVWEDSPIYSLCGPRSAAAPSSAIPRCSRVRSDGHSFESHSVSALRQTQRSALAIAVRFRLDRLCCSPGSAAAHSVTGSLPGPACA